MVSNGRFRFYAVRKGRHPGIYTTWEDCRREVDGFRDNQHKGFMKKSDALAWLTTRDPLDAEDYILKPDIDRDATVVANKMSSLLLASSGEDGEEGSSSGHVGTLSSFVPTEIDEYVDQNIDWSQFVFIEDMEHLLNRACSQLDVGPPIFFRHDGVHRDGLNYMAFCVVVQSKPNDVNILVSGKLATDERLARQDAAFATLEKLLSKKGLQIFDYNYHVVRNYKRQLEEMTQALTNALPERVRLLEQENQELKQTLAIYSQIFSP